MTRKSTCGRKRRLNDEQVLWLRQWWKWRNIANDTVCYRLGIARNTMLDAIRGEGAYLGVNPVHYKIIQPGDINGQLSNGKWPGVGRARLTGINGHHPNQPSDRRTEPGVEDIE